MSAHTIGASSKSLSDTAWDVGKGFYVRGMHAVYAVDNIQKASYCLILSVISTVVDLALFGRDDFLAVHCKHLQGYTGALLSRVASRLILVLNPLANIETCLIENDLLPMSNSYLNAWDMPQHLGQIILFQRTTIDKLYTSGDFLKRELGIRLFGLASGLVLTIIGVALTAFGALATIFALITFGCSPRVNAIASNNLRCIALVLNQPHQGIIGLFRPKHLVSSSLHYAPI